MSTHLPTRRVVPLPGRAGGYTVVTDHVVAYIDAGDVVAQSVLDGVVRRATAGGDAADRLVGLLSAPAALRYPGIAAVCSGPDGHEVIVSGGIEVVASGLPGTATTRDTTVWRPPPGGPLRVRVDRLTALTVGAVNRGSLTGLTDLRRGTVPSGGLVVTWTPEGPPAERTTAGGAAPAPWLRRPPGGAPTEAPPPVRVRRRAARPRIVDGVQCPRRHLNDPEVTYCATCGLTLPPAPRAVVRGPRPPLGLLVFDSGDAVELVDDLVVGRCPGDDPRVATAAAGGLVPDGDVSALSRSHAWISIRSWQIEVIDLGARNGTFRWSAALGGWDRLSPGVPTPLAHGDVLGFGQRTARVEPPGSHR